MEVIEFANIHSGHGDGEKKKRRGSGNWLRRVLTQCTLRLYLDDSSSTWCGRSTEGLAAARPLAFYWIKSFAVQ